jgi:hypothetical protein
MAVPTVNSDRASIGSGTGIQEMTDDQSVQSASTQQLQKIACDNRFLILDDEGGATGLEQKKGKDMPFSTPPAGSFTSENLSNAEDAFSNTDFSSTGFDIAELVNTLLALYLAQKEHADKAQSAEEKNIVQKIKAQATDVRKAAVFALAASIAGGLGQAAGGLAQLAGGLKGTDASLAKGEGWSGLLGALGKTASGGLTFGAQMFEAQGKDDEADEKLHEHKAEEAKRQSQNMQDAFNRTLNIVLETSKAQQENVKEIVRRG